MIIKVCVGSSCHLKGSPDVIAAIKEAIATHHLEDTVTLTGSFCIGRCSTTGVTVQVDDDVYVGINRDNVEEFIRAHIVK